MNIGKINGHIIGRVLKETVRRAAVVIRNETFIFEAHQKESYSGTMDDVFTSADKKAQDIYLRTFKECFPLCGVIAEEDSLTINPSGGCTAYFTVDPLDGTKAYVRRQSHGVATMVSLVDDGIVQSAYVGDINTDEVYGFRPDSDKVFRITRLDSFEELLPGKKLNSKADLFCILRNPLEKHSKETQDLVKQFKNYEIMGSSIGTWMARLWKGEVSALVMDPGWETPWDSTPVDGISLKLGYVFLKSEKDKNGKSFWKRYEPKILKEKERREYDTLIIHENNLHLISDTHGA
jgi:fructose-1,6-bisphosphatase/inositol monophosphatase family enzyme